jgi:hypothetical protein
MKLLITRDQAEGLLGGVNFELRAKVQLTNEEAELVKKDKADVNLPRLVPVESIEYPVGIE